MSTVEAVAVTKNQMDWIKKDWISADGMIVRFFIDN
jgi:hypothetical protein